MTHDEMIEVIQAHKEGKRLERMSKIGRAIWDDCYDSNLNFADYIYRVKPEPFECWGVVAGGEFAGEALLDTRLNPAAAFASSAELSKRFSHLTSPRVIRLVEAQDE